MSLGLAIALWLLASTALGLFVARAMHVGSRKRMPSPRPLPARLNPRAGQDASKAAHTTFTVLLALVVVGGCGLARAAEVAATAGGAQ